MTHSWPTARRATLTCTSVPTGPSPSRRRCGTVARTCPGQLRHRRGGGAVAALCVARSPAEGQTAAERAAAGAARASAGPPLYTVLTHFRVVVVIEEGVEERDDDEAAHPEPKHLKAPSVASFGCRSGANN